MSIKVGEFIDESGYDLMGTLQFDHGEVHILNNNSTTTLVTRTDDESMTDGEPKGEVIGLYHYGDEDGGWQLAYRSAIICAFDFVSRHLED